MQIVFRTDASRWPMPSENAGRNVALFAESILET
jgi:hypothetical protein